ncbi:hypothetical protein IGI04_035426 [Brassica rapa subsp. trilocularis]|uniref:RRM domain-containing protein n=1 Tax=Brassica rapa subsp. trilocularis TaxID=1813537 RepID=A0ABQ7LBK3_BRACM|nr:hypothetical protein IGI04_035426 [Brassica rapa subsp. trilocularis]
MKNMEKALNTTTMDLNIKHLKFKENKLPESEPEATFSEEEGDANKGGGDFPEPPEEANLFVGNLAYDVDSQALAMLFEQAGTVEIAEVNKSCDFARFLFLC